MQRFLLQRIVYNEEESLKCSFLMHPASFLRFFPPSSSSQTNRPTHPPTLRPNRSLHEEYSLKTSPLALTSYLQKHSPNLDEIKTHRNIFSFHPFFFARCPCNPSRSTVTYHVRVLAPFIRRPFSTALFIISRIGKKSKRTDRRQPTSPFEFFSSLPFPSYS